jgi:hypothetical protein
MDWVWRGNLRDDCTAVGYGLMLRAEMMDRSDWWWCVCDGSGSRGANQIASSNDEPPHHARTGSIARSSAERAANEFLLSLSGRGDG